jgi:hypothetical protein
MRPKLAPSLVLLMAFAAISLGVATDAGACSCEPMVPPAERFANAEAVFRGTVIEMDIPWSLRPSPGGELWRATAHYAVWSDANVTAVLEVHEWWKGVGTREIEMDLGGGVCCDCTLGAEAFEVGDELIIFAHESGGKLHVSRCRPPIPIDGPGSGLYLEFLGAGQPPPGPAPVRDENRTLTFIAAGFAALDRILRGP